ARATGRGGQLAALAVVGTVLLAPLPLAQGQASTPSFAAAANFPVGTDPYSVATVDVNGDGKLDLLVANAGSNTVSVLINQTLPGATTPSFAGPYSYPVGTTPVAVAAVEVNGDGRPDLLGANQGSNTVAVLLNQTAAGASIPSFAAATSFSVGTLPRSVAAADVNGDGLPDLLVANQGSNTVSVLLNTGAAGAGLPSFAAATS